MTQKKHILHTRETKTLQQRYTDETFLSSTHTSEYSKLSNKINSKFVQKHTHMAMKLFYS